MWAKFLDEPGTDTSTTDIKASVPTTTTPMTMMETQEDKAWFEFRSLGEQQKERDQLRAAEDERKRIQIETNIQQRLAEEQRAKEELERQKR